MVGHGFGAAGTLTVTSNGTSVTLPAGGRGIDQDGNGTIDSTEGSSAVPPNGIVSSRDGLRQTVADLMQLVRLIQVGMDVDGDGVADLDPDRIYYFGQSFGGIYGTKFIAVEPDVRAGVPNVPGGAIIEIVRLSPTFRPLLGIALRARVPSLSNAGGLVPPLWGFLRDRRRGRDRSRRRWALLRGAHLPSPDSAHGRPQLLAARLRAGRATGARPGTVSPRPAPIPGEKNTRHVGSALLADPALAWVHTGRTRKR